MGFSEEVAILEKQKKITIKRGLMPAFMLVWDCGPAIDPEGLV